MTGHPVGTGRQLEALCVLAATCALIVAIAATGARGAIACNNKYSHPCMFGQVHAEEDAFLNYDFTEENHSRYKVDWPIDMIFWNKSSVDYVKEILSPSFPERGSEMHAYLNNGFGWLWDEDGGGKTVLINPFGSAIHYRIYASPYTDRFFNVRWGYYNIASAHYDVHEGTPWEWSGDSEKAENEIAATWEQLVGPRSVFHSWIPFDNYEEKRVEGTHHWWNNGKVTKLRVPAVSEASIVIS